MVTNCYSPPMRDANGTPLPLAAKLHFGFNRCPCCRGAMSDVTVRKGKPTPAHKRTIGHDFSVAKGGDPTVWVSVCNACNQDQGSLDLVTWARKLVHYGDPRAEHVVALAVFVRTWVRENGRQPA